jgi:hypothetical protein
VPAAVLAALCCFSALPHATFAQPIAFDYRCEYADARAIADSGYTEAVLSWRANSRKARAVRDSLVARGIRVHLYVQPWARLTEYGTSTELLGYDADTVLMGLANRHDAWLRDRDGTRTRYAEWDMTGWGYDFRDTAFAAAYGEALAALDPKASGIYHDYGCLSGGLPWVASYRDVDPGVWPAWAAGYRRVFEAERRARPDLVRFCGCDWSTPAPEVCEVLALEGIGPTEQNFYSYRRALELCLQSRRLGKRTLLFCLRGDLRNRRVIAGISRLVPGTLISWRAADRPGGVWKNLRIPEWMDLDLGTSTSGPRQLAPNVWTNGWSHGVVVVNLSDKPYRYGERVVAPDDALVAQTRDRRSGAQILWRTNEGR